MQRRVLWTHGDDGDPTGSSEGHRETRLPPIQWSRAHDQDFIVPGNWFLCALHDRRHERENVRLAAPLVSCGLLEVHTECDASAIAACL
jgi:hypothetical protein